FLQRCGALLQILPGRSAADFSPGAAKRRPTMTANVPASIGTHAHILSVDVEDYFQVEAFASQVKREDWQRYACRVEANTMRLLDLFDRHNAKATFFFLGWVAERYPQLVREAHARGHEVACHSYWH